MVFGAGVGTGMVPETSANIHAVLKVGIGAVLRNREGITGEGCSQGEMALALSELEGL